MVHTWIAGFAEGRIGPETLKRLKRALLVFGSSVARLRAVVVIIPDGVLRNAARKIRVAGESALHAKIIEENLWLGGVGVMIVAQHQQEIEIRPRGHVPPGCRRVETIVADTRAEGEAQRPSVAGWGRGE